MNELLQLVNCDCCGELFVSKGHTSCKTCSRNRAEKTRTLRATIVNNPDISIRELTVMTGMPKDTIVSTIKHDVLVGSVSSEMYCRLCGRPIKPFSRKFACDRCYEKLSLAKKEKNFKVPRPHIFEQKKRELSFNNKALFAERTTSKTFQTRLKEHFGRYMMSIEVEYLPDIIGNNTLRLSNRTRFAPVFIC